MVLKKPKNVMSSHNAQMCLLVASHVNASMVTRVMVSNAKISMNVLRTLINVTLRPLVRILLEAIIVNATRDGEVMVSNVPI